MVYTDNVGFVSIFKQALLGNSITPSDSKNILFFLNDLLAHLKVGDYNSICFDGSSVNSALEVKNSSVYSLDISKGYRKSVWVSGLGKMRSSSLSAQYLIWDVFGNVEFWDSSSDEDYVFTNLGVYSVMRVL